MARLVLCRRLARRRRGLSSWREVARLMFSWSTRYGHSLSAPTREGGEKRALYDEGGDHREGSAVRSLKTPRGWSVVSGDTASGPVPVRMSSCSSRQAHGSSFVPVIPTHCEIVVFTRFSNVVKIRPLATVVVRERGYCGGQTRGTMVRQMVVDEVEPHRPRLMEIQTPTFGPCASSVYLYLDDIGAQSRNRT